MRRTLFKRLCRTLAAVGGLVALWASAAEAGQLILKNTSANPITCTVDGWTVASGATFDWFIQVQPGQPFYVGQNMTRPPGPSGPVINWVSCGGLTTRSMTLTAAGPSQTLVLNGQQTRVLNVSLYSYLPTLPTDQFEGLVNYVVQTYQAQNPQVLLNAVLSPAVDIYDFGALPTLFGAQGFDVIEMDTLYLGFLVSGGPGGQSLINPAQITGEQPLPVAVAGASLNGQLWGIPSWLCMDFVYSRSAAVKQQGSLGQLLQFFGGLPKPPPPLVGDFNGSWRLPSIYINAYVQTYGYANIANALQMPADAKVIANLASLSDACANASGVNICTNGTIHTANNNQNGAAEQLFDSGQASDDLGFSEQSFYVNLYAPGAPIYLIPTPWGQSPQPLLFQDAFFTSKATCAPGTACAGDAQAFTTLMTGVAMKNYITQSQDLPAGSPWRTLLVANAGFWKQPAVQANPVYAQVSSVFPTAQPFPNAFTADLQNSMGFGVCAALQAVRPAYVCKTSSAESKTVAAPAPKPKAQPRKTPKPRRAA